MRQSWILLLIIGMLFYVGYSNSSVWTQTAWSGGACQSNWSIPNMFWEGHNINISVESEISLMPLSITYDSPEGNIYCMGVYDNKLYTGSSPSGIVYVYDGSGWNISYDSPQKYVNSLREYNGKLYAATRESGKVYVYDGVSWSLSFDGAGENEVLCLEVYNNKLYAGTYSNGRVYVYDGSSWLLSYDSPANQILYLKVYNSKLYASSGNNPGRVYVYDGSSWTLSNEFTGTQCVYCLEVYNGKLYAGSETGGRIYVYDESSWILAHDSNEDRIRSFCVYNGKLYVGGYPNGIIYAYDGTTWGVHYDLDQGYVRAMCVYQNKLFVGTGPNGIIYIYDAFNSPNYATSGYLISSSYDCGAGVNFGKISWNPTNQPSQCGTNPLKFQIATNLDNSTWNFLGPDGTSGTYYTQASGENIWSGHNGKRYIRYKVFFNTANTEYTPTLSDITITYGSGTYYVRTDGNDTNTGFGPSTTEAWQTIQKAANTMVAGNRVYVAPGTYNERVGINTGGSSGNQIQYVADPDASEFAGSTPSVIPGAVRVDGQNTRDAAFGSVYCGYITIDGFTMKRTMYGAITSGWTGTGWIITNNTIDSCGSGIGIEGMNNTSVKKFTISNNTICNLSYAYGTGIAVWGRSNYMIDTVVCENNTIYTTSGGWSKGICIGPPIGYAEVRGNMVYRIDGTFPDCGIGIRCDSVNSGYLITNTLYSNNRYGIQLTRSHNLTISNNLSDSNNTGGIRLLNASTNNTIVNNTITGNKGWGIFIRGSSYNTIDTNKISYNSSSGIRIHGELGKANSNVIKRNIIYSNTGKGVEVYYGGITDSIPKYNHITINSIYSNSTLGISLVGTTTNEGVVPPVITSIQQVGKGNYQVSGTAGTNYTVELFIAMGGSGKTYLGTSSANASGNWIDTVSATNTDTLIGTATTPNKSTSEFGAGVPVPFAVELVDFSAIGEYNSVKLTWQTESGIDNARWVIVRQNNNSEQWQPIATLFVGTHECMDTNVIAETEYKYMLGCMKTYNDTIWYGPVSATPKAYKFFNFILYESYPNPFKGNVHIKYEIPGRLPTSNKISTSLKIYNLIGREVKTLVSGTQEPGNYRISWDGRDETGKKVLNGIYFYQIEVGEFKATRKLTLLR